MINSNFKYVNTWKPLERGWLFYFCSKRCSTINQEERKMKVTAQAEEGTLSPRVYSLERKVLNIMLFESK